MTSPDAIDVEGRRVSWSSIVAAYAESGGLTVFWRTPPYVGWTEAGAGARAELRRRRLLMVRDEARGAWQRVLRQELDSAIDSGFRDPARAREILADCTVDGGPPSARLCLALVELSGGSLGELDRWCREAGIDYRDVYFNAWYAD